MGDRHDLPEAIYTHKQAAETARALTNFYQESAQHSVGDPLARLANQVASVSESITKDTEDESRYGTRVTFVDADGDPHTAFVLEPEVADMSADEAWDPYYEQFVNPQKAYPWGTVQLIYPEEGQFSIHDRDHPENFFFDRLSVLESATSVQPATGPDETRVYYPGWEYALDWADEQREQSGDGDE